MGQHLDQTNRRTFARKALGLVPIGFDRIRGNVRKESRATNVGGEHISRNFIAPCVLQGPGAQNGGVEVPGEINKSIRMVTRRIDSTEEVEIEL